MKKLILFSILSIWAVSTLAQIPAQNINISEQNKQVKISFTVQIPNDYVKSQYQAIITPMIRDGKHEQKLSPIVIYGKKREKRVSQEKALSGRYPSFENAIYLQNGDMLNYQTTIPYQTWMKKVSLSFDISTKGCCGPFTTAEQFVTGKVNLQNFQPAVSPFIPFQSETEKLGEPFVIPFSKYNSRNHPRIEVFYPLNVYTLNPDYKDNGKTINRIVHAIRTIQKDPWAELNKIIITGLASPEGGQVWNEQLADKRAFSLKQYLIEETGIKNDLFDLINGGPDWNGLKKIVKNSNYDWKNEVLNILDNTPENRRIAEISALNGGKIYNFMHHNLFPLLRKACYIEIYFTPKLDETNASGQKAAEMVSMGKYADTIPLLNTLPSSPWRDNMLGVCYEKQENRQKAIQYFTEAAAKGDTNAANNLKQLE